MVIVNLGSDSYCTLGKNLKNIFFPEICNFIIIVSNNDIILKRFTNFVVSCNNCDVRQNDILGVRLAASSRPRRNVAALLGSGNTFPVFPTGFYGCSYPAVVTSL